MKKSLLALAVLGAFAASAQAQSSVTVYGVADAGVRYKTNANAAGDSVVTMNSGVNTATRLGFRGVEDLGGGLNARFTLEMGYDISSGTGTSNIISPTGSLFDRTASVGLGGKWGGVDFGLQYSVAFKTIAAIDPFEYKYTGIIPLAGLAAGNQVSAVTPSWGGTRFLNDIQYTGNFGPVTVRAEYALGEQAGSTNDGAAQAIGATYAANGISVAGAYTRRNPSISNTALGTLGFQDNDQWVLGAAYTSGPVRVAGGYMHETQEFGALGDVKNKTFWFGGGYNFTPAFSLTAGYYQTKLEESVASKRKMFILGTTYALSKRTALYANADHTRFDGATFSAGPTRGLASPAFYQSAPDEDKQSAFSFGVVHAF